MSLARVEITQEVLLTCMTHAFTTEGEEIMGLLLGDIVEESGVTVSHIWMAYPQIRTDRRKDRVETSPEQMARCSAHAERLSRETGTRTRVVGWYHSHPHITVLPSHIDVRTQAMYQMLDPGFVGLIFSVFNTDSAGSKAGHLQVTAFQSVPVGHPLAAHGGGQDGGQLESYSSEALQGLDTPTKEAIRRSAESHSPAAMARREVPLTVAPARSAAESSLHDLVVVQRILAMEEKEAYKAATAALGSQRQSPQQSGDTAGGPSGQGSGGPMSSRATPGLALAQLHAAGVYQQGLAHMLDTTVSASLVGLRSLAAQQALHATQLAQRNAALKELLANRQKQLQQLRTPPASVISTQSSLAGSQAGAVSSPHAFLHSSSPGSHSQGVSPRYPVATQSQSPRFSTAVQSQSPRYPSAQSQQQQGQQQFQQQQEQLELRQRQQQQLLLLQQQHQQLLQGQAQGSPRQQLQEAGTPFHNPAQSQETPGQHQYQAQQHPMQQYPGQQYHPQARQHQPQQQGQQQQGFQVPASEMGRLNMNDANSPLISVVDYEDRSGTPQPAYPPRQ